MARHGLQALAGAPGGAFHPEHGDGHGRFERGSSRLWREFALNMINRIAMSFGCAPRPAWRNHGH